jgi:hypothetical protein
MTDLNQEFKSLLDANRLAFETGNKEMLANTEAKFSVFEKANQELTSKIAQEEKSRADLEEKVKEMEAKLSRPGFNSKSEEGAEEVKSFNQFLKTREIDKKYLRTDAEAQGGVFIPQNLQSEIIKAITLVSPIRSIARVISSPAKSVIMPVRKTVAANTRTGEGISGAASNSTYGQEEIFAGRYTGVTEYTIEMLAQSILNVESEIRTDLVEDLAQKEGFDFVKGTGVKTANGFMNAGAITNIVNSINAGAVVGDDLIKMTGEIKSIANRVTNGYNPYFILNSKTLSVLRRLKGSTNDHYLFTAGIEGEYPNKIAGFPYIIAEDMDDIGSNKDPIAFGDFRRGYYILDNVNTYVTVDQVTKGELGIYKYIMHKFTGGKVVLPEALCKLHTA